MNIKTKAVHFLRGGAVVLAILAAFAFRSESNIDDPQFGYDATEEKWYDVTSMTEGVDFLCNTAPQSCLYDAVDGQPIQDSEGEFVPGSGLEPIE